MNFDLGKFSIRADKLTLLCSFSAAELPLFSVVVPLKRYNHTDTKVILNTWAGRGGDGKLMFSQDSES